MKKLFYNAKKSVFEPAFATGDAGCIDPSDAVAFAASDQNRIVGNITAALVRKTPFVDVIAAGPPVENNVSHTTRVVIQEQAVLNQSLVAPVFTDDTQMCGTVGPAAEVGSTEYQVKVETLRGMGPMVCIKQMRNAFKTAYSRAEQSLQSAIVKINNSDSRYNLMNLSGLKLTVKSGESFTNMLNGDQQALETPFADIGEPNAPMNFKLLQYLGRFMREDMQVETYEGQGEILKVIAGSDIIDKIRDEAGVKTDQHYLAAGSYTVGRDAILAYSWEGPYRGFAFGTDPQPLRFSTLNDDGFPNFIEPEISREVTNNVGSRVNPAWVRARYEIMLVTGRNSFSRSVPRAYTGEAGFRFPAQAAMGELRFRVIPDNCNNVWEDWGRHYYQIIRQINPERPHAVCAVAFKRCNTDFGLEVCDDQDDYSSVASL